MSISKYKAVQAQTENPRQTEYRLFAEVTKAMIAVKDQGLREAEFYKAVDWNRRLWLALQMDLSQENNQFPDELKARIISIAIWVDRHSRRALKGEATIDSMIAVNRTIMEGLAAMPQRAAPPVQPISAGGESALRQLSTRI